MVNFNLLPWRIKRRAHQLHLIKKIISVAFLGAVAISVGMHWYIVQEIDKHELLSQQFNRVIHNSQTKIREVQQLKVTSPLLQQQSLLEQQRLQQLLQVLTQDNYHAVCFTALTRDHERFTFAGNARSLQDLVDFLKHWRAAALFTEIKMEELLTEKQLIKFSFTAIMQAAAYHVQAGAQHAI